MTDPVFGIKIVQIDDEARPVIGADLSTVGIIGPADDADETAFPLDTPVLVFSNDTTTLGKLGTSGYIPDAIEGVNDQLGDLELAAKLIIVRTASGVNADPAIANQLTIVNVMGSSLDGTGLWAFLKAPDLLGFTPRLILAPGYTGQLANSVGEVNVTTPGGGYIPGKQYALTFSAGGVNPSIVQATGHAIADEDGAITQDDVFIDTFGAWYTVAPTVALPAPDGTGTHTPAVLTATMVIGANPICAMATPVLNQLVGHAVFESAGTSEVDDDNWRDTIDSERIIGLSGGVKVLDPVSGLIIARPFAPRFAGIMVRRDNETGAPFHSAANQPVQGIIGPLRQIQFSLVDGDNEGQQLLLRNMGILVRGQAGIETAISTGGFIAIATDNLGDDELWRFYNVKRGRDFIHLSLIQALRIYLGRENITGHTIQAILNTIGFFLRDLQADDHILGYQLSFNGSTNSADEIRLGHLTVGFAAEEPPVLRKITTQSARYRPAIDAMVAALAAQLNLAA